MVAGRHIRLTAVLVTVVFALTGFSSSGGSSGSSSGKSKSKSSSGGGCSSSKSKNKKKSHSSGNSGSSATPSPSKTSPPAHAVVVTCAGPGKKEAVLKVTSDVSAERTVDVPLTFQGANGAVDRNSVRITLKGKETRTVTVSMVQVDKAAEVQNCVVGRID
ncbi:MULTISPECIES: hypothetical protein [unclassified Streptomyces]|uniref:hypothetical protein n=1 Tax=unclassified Streptomyces TaxID=2593676 RepID=UPI00224C7F73|nr:hypothetical protein [Streptomyces sp. NBC_00047]MCX5606403.1 hypothetical protein [Streptomyces sp. NBC_00047]